MCVSATVNGSNIDYVLSSTGSVDAGWMAVGFGTSMSNTPMIIAWANSDGTITLSHREASGHVMPTVQDSPTRTATLLSSLSSTSSDDTKFAFSVPSNGETTQDLIYAIGATNPGSSDAGASIQIHRAKGSMQLDLTKDLSESSGTTTNGPSSTSSPSSDGTEINQYHRLVIVHAIFCVIGFLLVLPFGALLARYLRTTTSWWFKGHWIVQLGLGGSIITVGIALGVRSVYEAGSHHLDDEHKKWGVAIAALYLFQALLGIVIHFFKPRSSASKSRRPPQNYLHAIVGLLIIALALKQVRNGYKTEWPGLTGLDPLPKSVDIVWYVWVALLPVLYFLGLAFLPRQFRQEREGSYKARQPRY